MMLSFFFSKEYLTHARKTLQSSQRCHLPLILYGGKHKKREYHRKMKWK